MRWRRLLRFSPSRLGRRLRRWRERPRRRSAGRRRLWRWAGAVGLVGLVVFGGYVAWLDHQVRAKFEGKRWSIPARVYARPLELFAGAPLGPDRLARELALLKYRVSSRLDTPGSFQRRGDTIQLYTRAFHFWDGQEPARRVTLRFDGDFLLEVRGEGGPLSLVRLDPVMIGGIYPSHNEDRVLVKLEQVPQVLIDALLAVEDREFYHHHGVMPTAILRALVANIRAGHTVQGGSTLTQQLVKNFYLSSDRTLWRKFNEAIMALLLEAHFQKNEILEAYLNEIYLGQDGNRAIHGFGLASQFYFEQPLKALKPAQIALLVGIVKGPSYYDPRRYPERAEARRDLVLDLMAEQGILTEEQALKARQRPLGVVPRRSSGITAYPAFLDLVRRQLRRDYRDEDLTSEGLRIFTTMDPLIQRDVEAVVTERTEALERRRHIAKDTLEAAALVAGTDTGEVVAAVGGRDPRYAGFNRALDAERHVGSLLKPAVYLTALAQPERYTLATLLDDSELKVEADNGNVWAPHNYDRANHGEVPLYQALAHSYNVATARLGLSLGVDRVIHTLRQLGVKRPLNPYPSVMLGATDLSPFEVLQMYQTLAAGGFRTPLKAIRDVTTSAGEPLQRYSLTVEQTVDAQAVFLVTRALQAVPRIGTARSLYNELPERLAVAGKTGTTDELKDSWFAGFTGDRVAVVWMGRDDNQPVGLTGASGALKLWSGIIDEVGARPLQPVAPPGIVDVVVDPATGLRADGGCPEAVSLPFIEGSAPESFAPCAQNSVSRTLDKTLRWLKGVVP